MNDSATRSWVGYNRELYQSFSDDLFIVMAMQICNLYLESEHFIYNGVKNKKCI